LVIRLTLTLEEKSWGILITGASTHKHSSVACTLNMR
jgi:hypothetical protein